jgi:hypothetical protein
MKNKIQTIRALFITASLSLGMFSCHPTPAELLEMEKLQQDSIAAVLRQQKIDSIAAAAADLVEMILIDTLPPDTTKMMVTDSLTVDSASTPESDITDTLDTGN